MTGAAQVVGAWRRTPARSARQVVVRGATSLAIVWEALWIAAAPALWPWRQTSPEQVLALWAVVVTWAVLLATQVVGSRTLRRGARGANVIALAAAATLALVGLDAPAASWSVASNLTVLCVGSAGMLLSGRVAGAAATVVVAVETSVALAVGSQVTDLLYPAFAFVVAVSSISSRAALVREAEVADEAAAASARVEADRRVHEGVEAAMRQQERALHATVLNTLTAIERGGLTTSVRLRLADRCREAAGVLRDLQHQSTQSTGEAAQTFDLDIDLAVADLRATGTRVEVDVDPMTEVPANVLVSLRGAVQEALSNIGRHAGATSCSVRGRVVSMNGVMRVHVEVDDDGIGFSPREESTRYGIAEGIARPMAEVGGTATLDSAPGRGTRVSLCWSGAPTAAAGRAFWPSASMLAVPVLSAFGLFSCAAALSTLHLVARPGIDLLALVLLLLVYAMVMLRSRRGTLPAWLVIVTVLGASLAFVLQQRSGATGSGTWADWVSVSVAIVFFVVAGVGPRWAWAVVVVAWLVLQGDVLVELVSAGTAVLVAGALFGRSVRRNAATVERARAVERAQGVALAVAEASLRRLQVRYAALAESDVVELLDAIAAGELSPDDPQVRRRAAVDERFIRSLIRIDPSADPLRAVIAEVVRAARAAGLPLACDVGDAPVRASTDLSALRSSLLEAVTLSSSNGEARLTARREGDDVAVRLFADVADGAQDAAADLPVPGVAVEPLTAEGQAMLWEWRAPAAPVPAATS
ncbi:MAG: hypothetical protein U0R65_04345 [Candidatus Nanopelagicales bacterium]